MKPDDVSQEAWDAAFHHMDDFGLLPWIDGDDELMFQQCVARAIMVAVARERSACLNEISMLAGSPIIQPQSALARAYSAILARSTPSLT